MHSAFPPASLSTRVQRRSQPRHVSREDEGFMEAMAKIDEEGRGVPAYLPSPEHYESLMLGCHVMMRECNGFGR